MNNVYLDYAATTPVDSEIYDSYLKLLEESYANADSTHYLGNVASNYLKMAREKIAELLNLQDEEVIFTSGSTEANNLAIKGAVLANANRGKSIITTKVEHPSVLESFKQLEEDFGFSVTYLDVDKQGRVDLKQLKNSMKKSTVLVSIMAVNNEIGTINDIYEVCNIVKGISPKTIIHVDATQAMGKENIDYSRVDLYNFSSHKMFGLKGCGVLIKSKKIRLMPQIVGGEQENGYRGGTSNWQTYTMMAKTLRKALESRENAREYVRKLNRYFRDKLLSFNLLILNSPLDASPYIINFTILKKKGEVILNALSNNGICVSSKSACSSKSDGVSVSVFEVSKDEEVAKNSIRVSLSHITTKEEIDYFLYCLKNIIEELK